MKQRDKMKKALAVCTALLMLACSLSACGGASKEGAEASSTLSGKLSLAGSTSMEKLCEAMSE